MTSFAFRPEYHLRHRDDFRRVYERRRSVADDWLIVYACENDLPHLRLGMSVSRKFGKAVKRNRLRRLYREAFRLTRPTLPVGMDIILIPRKPAQPTLAQLQQSLKNLVPRLARRLEKEKKQTSEVSKTSEVSGNHEAHDETKRGSARDKNS